HSILLEVVQHEFEETADADAVKVSLIGEQEVVAVSDDQLVGVGPVHGIIRVRDVMIDVDGIRQQQTETGRHGLIQKSKVVGHVEEGIELEPYQTVGSDAKPGDHQPSQNEQTHGADQSVTALTDRQRLVPLRPYHRIVLGAGPAEQPLKLAV